MKGRALLDRKRFCTIPRRIPRIAAFALATLCIGFSALIGLRASRSYPGDVLPNEMLQSLQNDDEVPPPYVVTEIASPLHDVEKHVDSRVADYEMRSDVAAKGAPGERGVGVPFSFFKEKEKEALEVYRKETFNLMASDVISMQRELPQLRSEKCLARKYDFVLPSASVIIVFFNEPLSSLLRTIWSVINRSRPEYLAEVIMVDDFSDRTELKQQLDEYIKLHFAQKVRVLRSPVHKGLIQGKLTGARNASADVLVFLDSHCEVNVGWLEPLLTRIKENQKIVACPLVDTISAKDHSVTASASWATGLFTWSLYYRWGPQGLTAAESKRVKDADFEPHRTPTFPGGLFAMTRTWFFEAGAYDEQMEGWGGENLEMSFRVWMCGGGIEFVPCSRVGHGAYIVHTARFVPVSRSHTYNFQDEEKNHAVNSARLAEVWMDDYKRLYYIARPKMKGADVGVLETRKAIRENLKCHSFKWYLENVFAEKFIPDEQSTNFGQLRIEGTKTCLHTQAIDDHWPKGFITKPCVDDKTQREYLLQLFALSTDNELRREEWCIDRGIVESVPDIQSYVCYPDSRRIWTHNNKHQLQNARTGLCLRASDGAVTLQTCSDTDTAQKWQFLQHFDANPPMSMQNLRVP